MHAVWSDLESVARSDAGKTLMSIMPLRLAMALRARGPYAAAITGSHRRGSHRDVPGVLGHRAMQRTSYTYSSIDNRPVMNGGSADTAETETAR